MERLQARILEWVAIPSSRGSSWPRDRPRISSIGRWVLYCYCHLGSPSITLPPTKFLHWDIKNQSCSEPPKCINCCFTMVNVLYQIVYQIIIVSYLYCELDSHGCWVYCWLSILFHWPYWFCSLLCLSIPPFPQAHSLCLGCDSLSQWTLLSEVLPLFFRPLKSRVHVLLPCLAPPPLSLPQRFFWVFRGSWWSVLPSSYPVCVYKWTGMASGIWEVCYHQSPEEGVGELCRVQISSHLEPTDPPTASSDLQYSYSETPLTSGLSHLLTSKVLCLVSTW